MAICLCSPTRLHLLAVSYLWDKLLMVPQVAGQPAESFRAVALESPAAGRQKSRRLRSRKVRRPLRLHRSISLPSRRYSYPGCALANCREAAESSPSRPAVGGREGRAFSRGVRTSQRRRQSRHNRARFSAQRPLLLPCPQILPSRHAAYFRQSHPVAAQPGRSSHPSHATLRCEGTLNAHRLPRRSPPPGSVIDWSGPGPVPAPADRSDHLRTRLPA